MVTNEFGETVTLPIGTLFFKVNKETFEMFNDIMSDDFEFLDDYVYYSTELAAQSYIYWNKPLFSRNQVYSQSIVSVFGNTSSTACLGCGTPLYGEYPICNKCNETINN